MRPLLTLALLLSLSACPPDEASCEGPAFDDGGVVLSPLQGYPAIGHTLTRVMTAPVTTCRTEATATIEVYAPGNRRSTGTVGPVSIIGRVARANATFTPDEPGRWSLSVSFSGLGERTVDVDVLPAFREGDATPLVIPPGVSCPRGPWVVSQTAGAPDFVRGACEQPDASIALFTLDGGDVSTVGGMHLAVAEDVAWLLSADGTQLERHAWRDGGLELTDRWNDFVPTRIGGEHSRTRAVRAQSGYIVRVIDLVDAVDSAQRSSQFDFEDALFSYEADGASNIQADRSQELSGVVALEPRAKWRFNSLTPEVVSLERRPINIVIPGGVPIPLPPGKVRKAALEPMERAPLWVSSDAGALFLAVDPSGLTTTIWPNLPLVRAGDHFVILQALDGGFLLFTR